MYIPEDPTGTVGSSLRALFSLSFSFNNEAFTSASALNRSFSILEGENAPSSRPSSRLTYDPRGEIPCGVVGRDILNHLLGLMNE